MLVIVKNWLRKDKKKLVRKSLIQSNDVGTDCIETFEVLLTLSSHCLL